ncbi:MAG TPA: APC family permease [Terriglobales bacterium]|nr:APC family permease [Terriglobales bacterium]
MSLPGDHLSRYNDNPSLCPVVNNFVMSEPAQLVRALGRWSLAALMLNTVIGASIYGLPSLLAGYLGALSPLGYVLTGLGIATIAVCLAEVSSQFEQAGGPYLYARAAFGSFAAIQIGWLTWLTRVVACAAGVNLFLSYLGQFLPPVENGFLRVTAGGVLVAILACVNYVGVTAGLRVNNFFAFTKILALLVFVVCGLVILMAHPTARVPVQTVPITTASWFSAVLLMIYSFAGFEAALFVSGEIRNPRKDAPVALLIALLGVTVLYVAVQYVVIHTLPLASASSKPVADSARHFLGPVGASLIAIGALISAFGYLSANMLHTPRLTFAMAEQGDFPAFFSTIHPRYRTPSVSIVVFAALVAVFSAAGSFQSNATLAAVSRIFVYASIAAALPILRRRNPRADAFRVPGAMLFVVTALVFTGALVFAIPRNGIAFLLLTFCLAFLNWVWSRRRLPEFKHNQNRASQRPS